LAKKKARQKRQKRRILLFLSDTQGGHKLGLMNPAVTLVDEAVEHGTLESEMALKDGKLSKVCRKK
jgi:hypothetical protein